MKISIYTDGACRGNPGKSSIGIAIFDEKNCEIATHKEYIGEATNNIAEYKAVIKALELALEYSPVEVRLFSDSKLLVMQLSDKWKIKTPHIRELYLEAKKFQIKMPLVIFTHVAREKNKRADALANQALDEL